MDLTQSQKTFLDRLPLEKWLRRDDIQGGRSPLFIQLMKEGYLLAVNLLEPKEITNEMVEKGEFVGKIVPFSEEFYWPDFIKKINEPENSPRIKELQKRIEYLEAKLKEIMPNN